MAIAERMPEVGRRFYENVLAKTINRLADYLQAHVGPDDLAIDDCGLAAAQFMQMCQATLFLTLCVSGRAGAIGGAHRFAPRNDGGKRVDLATYAILLAGALAGGFVSGLAGFGTALMALGIWLYILPPAIAVPLVLICSVSSQISTLPSMWKVLDFKLAWPFVAGGSSACRSGRCWSRAPIRKPSS
jgi:hypothetical protein